MTTGTGAHLDLAAVAARADHAVRPWTSDQLTVVVAADAVAAVVIVAAAVMCRTADTAGAQVGWLNLAVGGLVIAGGFNGMWLSRARRSLRQGYATVLGPGGPSAAAPGSAAGAVSDDQLVAMRGALRFHRRSCPLVAGKVAVAASRRTHDRAGRVPCEVCHP